MIRHLVVGHYHLRPGGVRRVIERGLPGMARELGMERITLAVGEAAEAGWSERLGAALPGVELRVVVERAFRYTAEQRVASDRLRARLRVAAGRLLAGADALWLHNPGLARNVPLVEALGEAARVGGVPAVFHHHDFWFENRWARAAEFRALGYRSVEAVGRVIFPGWVAHGAINRRDLAPLRRAFGGRARWLPNPMPGGEVPSEAEVGAARRWLAGELGDEAPVWIVPTRLLRRKNVAEAMLLTRWLRPGAWMVTTAAVSSAGERAYAGRLAAAARRGDWRVRLAMLAGREERESWQSREGVEGGRPSVAALMAVAEVVLLTSVQEGFGLPAVEAMQVGRPLLARELPNVGRDLRALGFRLPQVYDEVWVARDCFDEVAERARQAAMWRAWRGRLPVGVRGFVDRPEFLAGARGGAGAAGADGGPVAFSRLSLAAQLEVLAWPAEESWARCAAGNPTLARWRGAELAGAEWPAGAEARLGEAASARRFGRAWRAARGALGTAEGKGKGGRGGGAADDLGAAVQREMIAERLGAAFHFPILMEEA